MAVINELIRLEKDGTLSFGNYLLDTKRKFLDFEVDGNLYNLKTFKDITKLEKNGKLLYESVPGTTVHNFSMTDKKVMFDIEAEDDSQLTMELEPNKDYKIIIDNVIVGKITTNLSGKINFSVEYTTKARTVKIEKLN